MVKTLSTMLPLGEQAPEFRLPDPDGNLISLGPGSSEAKGHLVMFICNHCPFVVHIIKPLVDLCKQFQERGIQVIAINSNDVDLYPADHPDRMKDFAREHQFSFPYLFDESQDVAKNYQAACTPDFYLFDSSKRLVYRGQLDDSRPGNEKPVDGSDLRGAVDQLLAGQKPVENQIPSMGCNIKWKPGQAPSWFG